MQWPKSIELKTLVPATRGHVITRDHLSRARQSASGTTVLDVSAPAGFGRTKLLQQWYTEEKAAGSTPIWISLDAADTHKVLAQCLALGALSAGHVRTEFAEWMVTCEDALEALTGWIVEIRKADSDVFLILDDMDQVAPALLHEGLAFIMSNAPDNLSIAMATLPGDPIFATPALFGLPLHRISAQALRFRPVETAATVAASLPRTDDAAAFADAIHDLTDGWPLGVALAVASYQEGISFDAFKTSAAQALSRYFADGVLMRQPEAVREMLTGLAHLDPIHRDLCKAVSDPSAPLEALDAMVDVTPVMTTTDNGAWYRLHPVARSFLQDLQSDWPQPRVVKTAAAAAHWYAEHSLFEEASGQAKRAEDQELALDLAARAIDVMRKAGRFGDIIAWSQKFTGTALMARADTQVAVAWAYTSKGQFSRAQPLVTQLQNAPETPQDIMAETHLMVSAHAVHSDLAEADDFLKGAAPSPDFGPDEQLVHASFIASRALMMGQPTTALDVIDAGLRMHSATITNPAARAVCEAQRGIVLLWAGKPRLAYDYVKPALSVVESEYDRRTNFAVILAAVHAHTAMELMNIEEARLVLTDRLSLLEREPVPDAVIYAFIAAARLAEAEDRFDQVEAQLEGLAGLGRARNLPRMTATALSQLVRFHVRHHHSTLAQAAFAELEKVTSALPVNTPPFLAKHIRLHRDMARATLVDGAQAAQSAHRLAQELNRGRDVILAQGLLAVSQLRAGDGTGKALLQDAIVTAHARGLVRLKRELEGYATDLVGTPVQPTQVDVPRPQNTDFLTGREFDVLCGLGAALSNAEIALSLGLSEQTVKWHLKNLYQKLDASDRKVAVAKAKMHRFI